MTEDFLIRNGVLERFEGKEELAVIPEGVHTIGEGAFKGCVSLRMVIFPSSIRRILAYAFKGCRKLEEAEIPEGVGEIGDYAFHRCHALKKITLPFSVEELGHCVFLYCDSLEEARIPGVKKMGRQVFLNDLLLKKLEINPELSLDCICDVFTGCGKLEEISLAGGETYAFSNAVEVTAGNAPWPPLIKAIAADVLRMAELDGSCLVRFLTNLKHVEVPEGITRIGKSCFFDKRGILSVKLPGSLREIDSRAFRNCINLETVIFEGKQVCIHEDAFKNCTSLKNVRTGDGNWHELAGIGFAASKHGSELVETIHRQILGNFRISGTVLLNYLGEESRVVVPEGIRIIAEDAFAGNETIDRIILPESLREIGPGAFRDCLLLQVAGLPQNLERIGAHAFENCVKLIRVILPAKVTEIETAAFKRCRVLKEVVLSERTQVIGEQAFYGCSALSQISLPRSLTAIGEMAFYRCEVLKEIRIPAGAEYVGSLAFAQSGIKRACLSGSGKHYGSDVFSQCLQLKSLRLEEGVQHMGDKLAYGCAALRQVSLPCSLESVGRQAVERTPFGESWHQALCQGMVLSTFVFWDGHGLEGEVWLPQGTRILAGGAFYGNEKISVVHLPESLGWVGPAAFKGCQALKKVFWPTAAERVEDEVFAGCEALESVETSAEWRFVGHRAFYGCRQLKHVSLNMVHSIGKEAFSGCSCLEAVPVGDGCLTSLEIGERALDGTPFLSEPAGGMSAVGNVIVDGGACRGEVCIPQGTVSIAPFAFERNQAITKVTLPDGLLRVGEGAFWGCKNLKEISFPENQVNIGERAFEKCVSLKEISLRAGQMGQSAFAYCQALEKAELLSLVVLAERTFEGCRRLSCCVFPQGRRVEAWCFSQCESLRDFDFRPLRYVGDYAFENCDSLSQVECLDQVMLRPHSFQDCGRLKEVRLNGSSEGIDLREYAFSGCTALETVWYGGRKWRFSAYGDILSEKFPEIVRQVFHSAMSCFAVEGDMRINGYRGSGRIVKIPQGICEIAAEVFRDQLMLEEVIFPSSLRYIGSRAFHGTAWMERRRQESPMVIINHMLLDGSGCEGQTDIPADIELICGWAFANGLKIEKLRFPPAKIRVEEHAFRNCINLKEVILPDGSLVRIEGIGDRKKEWIPLARQIVTESLNCCKTDEDDVLVECTGNISCLRLPGGITAIGDGAFKESNLLTEVIFPETITRIGKQAFADCKWLKTVRQAQKVERIGTMAFLNCGTLEQIELSSALQSLGERAFENCTSLREIQIPEGVEEIPDKAFYRCHSLRNISLPSTLKRIGKEAFAFCREMEMPEIPEGTEVGERAFAGIKTWEDICVIEG